MPIALDALLNLAIALGIGLLIGAERGWSARAEEDSNQVAGIRTFALGGLSGGLATLLAQHLGVVVWVALFAAFALLVIAGYLGDLLNHSDRGLTSEIALLSTFALGSLALAEQALLAAGAAVVVALLLSMKAPLHAALQRLTAAELSGAFKLLFISLVLLPALPNQTYGPWAVFNPYATWWMVVLIAGLGFIAYAAIRLLGTRHGLLVTALLGGIVSSTAMTLTLARLHRQHGLPALLAAGLLAASALMFPRVLLEVGLLNPSLLTHIFWPLTVTGLCYAGGALWFWRQAEQPEQSSLQAPLKNPFELGPALRFAALLVLILFLVEAGNRTLGDTGVYLVALLSGLADVDAITLSLARGDLPAELAARGIFLAALSNSLVKAGLIALIGGRQLALRTWPVIAGGLLAGLGVLWLSG
ncbi:MAG: MgtC/SapB family protein [Pseudomonas sp.]